MERRVHARRLAHGAARWSLTDGRLSGGKDAARSLNRQLSRHCRGMACARSAWCLTSLTQGDWPRIHARAPCAMLNARSSVTIMRWLPGLHNITTQPRCSSNTAPCAGRSLGARRHIYNQTGQRMGSRGNLTSARPTNSDRANTSVATASVALQDAVRQRPRHSGGALAEDGHVLTRPLRRER